MNTHLEELRKLSQGVHDNMELSSQKVIDMVEETIEQLDRDYDEEPIQRDELGAINYDINILIEVYNPEFHFDLSVLRAMDKIIEQWYKEVEWINRTLGLPPEKG